MLGFFLADGWIDRDRERGYDRLSFACMTRGIIEKLQGIFCRRFDVSAVIGEKDGMYTLRVHSTSVNRQIIEAFGLQRQTCREYLRSSQRFYSLIGL